MQAISLHWTWSKHDYSTNLSQSVGPVSSPKEKFLHFSVNANRVDCSRILEFVGHRHRNGLSSKHLTTSISRYPYAFHCRVSSAQNAVSSYKETLNETQRKKWQECEDYLKTLNFSVEEVDRILGKAFGWVHSPYWGEEKEKTVPDHSTVHDCLNYLSSLGISNDDLHKLLQKFPEVLGCRLDDEIKNNVTVLEREWGIKGNSLRNVLLRNPRVLGYNVDCKGDCMAQCTRCWARF